MVLTFFSTKNNGLFQILTFEILTEMLTNEVVSFEQLGPVLLYLKKPKFYLASKMLNRFDIELV